VVGASVAWHLRGDHDVTLLEQGPAAGAEASGQNAGILRTLDDSTVDRALALRTWSFLREAGEPFAGLSRGVGGLLGLAWDGDLLSDAVAHLRRAGVPLRPADPASGLHPALRAPLRAAWSLPEDRVVDPTGLVQAFLAEARQSGVRCARSTPAQRLVVRGGAVVGVATPEGELPADVVVVAAGAWSRRLVAAVGPDRPLICLRRHLHLTAPDPAARSDLPWVWLEDAGLYLRPEGGGWLWSGCDEAEAPAPVGPGSQGPVEPAVLARSRARLAKFFPSVAALEVRTGWSGLRTFAPDRAPLLGFEPELPGLFWAAGLGGAGVSGCVGVGEAARELIAGRVPAWLSRRAVDPGRPQPRRMPIRAGGGLDSLQLLNAT
jgi:D-arginine dehydrogenase